MIFQTEKQLKEFGDKLSAPNKSSIEAALTDLKSAFDKKDISAIDVAMAAINTAWQAASQEMYNAQQAGPQDGAASGANASQNSDGVTDVEFEEVGGEKK